jgi:hypothetical protein
MSIDSQLIHTCTMQRATTSQRRAQRRGEDLGHVATNVRCRLVIKRPSASAIRPLPSGPSSPASLLVPARTDVQQGDRMITVVDEEGTVDSGPFAILEVMKRRGRAVKHISLLLERSGQDGAAT